MECVERALKSGLRREVAAKAIQNQGMVVDDLWEVTSGQAGVDEFFVDDFLDLSNGDDDNDNIVVEPVPEPEPEPKPKPKPKQEEEEEEEEEEEHEFKHVPKQEQPTGNCNSSKHNNFPSLSPTELTVPADDLGDLEWLSHFVEDSFTETEYSLLTYPTGNLPTTQSKEDCTQNRSGSQPHPHPPNPCFNPPVPGKARTKRARTGGRVWSLGSPSADTSSTSSSSTSSSTSSSPSSAWLIYSHSPAGGGPAGGSSSLGSANNKPPAKKQKRKSGSAADAHAHAPPPPPRRCSHCHVQKTPQWRTGPMGAKTLCNACGVRFKSGRLLPEYRPACSPTFSSDLHSNNHRKVLEMRRKKETELSEPGVASAAAAVQSF